MKKEQIELRKQAAKLLHEALLVVKKIETDNWDVPAERVADYLRWWSRMYGYKEARK